MLQFTRKDIKLDPHYDLENKTYNTFKNNNLINDKNYLVIFSKRKIKFVIYKRFIT